MKIQLKSLITKNSESSGVNKEGSLETDSSSEYTRESWGSRFEFLFSCIGYAVGLGNIWRFPYLCYENGGAAFLIPYFCCLIVCGIPMFLLEISFGQFSSNSPIKVWRISPIFRGVGYGLIMTSSIVCIYYNVIMAWALYYFIASFSSTLPWAVAANNYTSSFNASLIYWQNTVLIQSDSLSAMSTVNWKLLGCLFLVWIVTSLCVVKGVSLSGKIMYVTSTMPYIIILIFIVRSSLLVGAGNGLYYYVVPDSSKISNPRVWFKAANQIFFSLGPGLGPLITYSSFNKFKNNVLRDVAIVPLLNSFSSIFFGIAVFAIMGNLAHELNVPVDQVMNHGAGLGLVFVAYPATIAKMGYAQFWSILFFLNILLVGLDSIFAIFQTVSVSLIDHFSFARRHDKLCIFSLCSIMFLLGIPCVTDSGYYVVNMLNDYTAVFSMIFFCLCELVCISYIYGIRRFICDIELMLNKKFKILKYLMIAFWMYITPFTIFIVLCGSFYSTLSGIDNDLVSILGTTLALSVFAIPIFYAIYKAIKKRSFKKTFERKDNYEPKNEIDRQGYLKSLSYIPANYLWRRK